MTRSPSKTIALVLIILSACWIALLVWNQATMMAYSANYGIEASWLGFLPFLGLLSVLLRQPHMP